MLLRSQLWKTSFGFGVAVLGGVVLSSACGQGASDGGPLGGEGGVPDASGGAEGAAGGRRGLGGTGEGGDASGGMGGEVPPAARDLDEFFAALSQWVEPPEPKNTTSPPTSELRQLKTEAVEKWPFECEVVEHDIVERHDEILNFDSGAEYVKPGVLLVGAEFLRGSLAPIALPRAPITLSINVPGVKTASVVVTNPTTSNLQEGVAKLQAEANKAAQGSYAAQLSYEQHTVQSVEEMKFKLGVSAGFDGLFASASFAAKFEDEQSVEKYTVVSNLKQQMYSITFAQDAFSTPRDFFDPSITLEQLQEAERDGFLGRNNTPVFISSVTYGRMVVFSATSMSASGRTMLQSTLQAAGTSWSASAELSAEQRDFLATLDIEVLSIGGNQAEVTNAIRTGNWSDLYAGADILNSVPLRYTVRSLTGTRPVAALGDTTNYSVSECSALVGWYEQPREPGERFVDVATNPTNDPVMVVLESAGTYTPYRIEDDEKVPLPGYSRASTLDITVDDVGNAFIYDAAASLLSKLSVGSSAWQTGFTNLGILQMDAGAQDTVLILSATYAGDQNNMLRATWGQGVEDWLDESQNMKNNLPPYFAATGTGYVGRHGGELGYRAGDRGWTQYSADTAELNTVEKYTAASPSELYAVRIATGEVVKFNAASKKFDSYVPSPSGKAISLLEATSNGRLWATTSDGALYAYSPPR